MLNQYPGACFALGAKFYRWGKMNHCFVWAEQWSGHKEGERPHIKKWLSLIVIRLMLWNTTSQSEYVPFPAIELRHILIICRVSLKLKHDTGINWSKYSPTSSFEQKYRSYANSPLQNQVNNLWRLKNRLHRELNLGVAKVKQRSHLCLFITRYHCLGMKPVFNYM